MFNNISASLAQPYRATDVESNVSSEITQGPSHGLIIAPRVIPSKPHECSPPSTKLVIRIFRWLVSQTIHNNSLFKCKCGSVYRYNAGLTRWDHISKPSLYSFKERPFEVWVAAGGSLTPEEQAEETEDLERRKQRHS